MIIRVTQDDIDNGVRGTSAYCPIARAIKREVTADAHWIIAGYTGLWFGLYERGGYRATTPPIASAFMSKFDKHEAVEPIEFEVEFVYSG